MRFKSALVLSSLTACGLLFGQPGIASAAPPPSKQEQAKAKEAKADLSKDVETDRDVIQSLEHAKKQLQAEKSKDPTGHREQAIKYIQKAMTEIRAKTSKPGH